MNNSEVSISEWNRKNKSYRKRKRDAIADRYFNLYKGDRLNGLHLVAFWYGDDPEDSDTLMQSATNNYNFQLFLGHGTISYEEFVKLAADHGSNPGGCREDLAHDLKKGRVEIV